MVSRHFCPKYWTEFRVFSLCQDKTKHFYLFDYLPSVFVVYVNEFTNGNYFQCVSCVWVSYYFCFRVWQQHWQIEVCQMLTCLSHETGTLNKQNASYLYICVSQIVTAVFWVNVNVKHHKNKIHHIFKLNGMQQLNNVWNCYYQTVAVFVPVKISKPNRNILMDPL